MDIKIFDSHEALSAHAHRIIVNKVRSDPEATLGLATGSTPRKLYDYLAKDHEDNHTDYSRVSSFNLDEYLGIPSDHPNSYRHYMNEHLFDRINIRNDRTHIPSGSAMASQKTCSDYEALLDENPVDIQVLGIGNNGHIGFNEPGTSFGTKTHIVALKKETREANARYFNGLDEVPKKAVTMGIQSIMKAKHIILLASGKQKAKAVKATVEGPITTDWPASILRTHDNVTMLLDENAAKYIKEDHR